ncbi:hypothetical protein ADIARSV_0316 [Arcticibacter svalbardensis MN12-7]|uniref:Transposase n=1 Tax=Arcticibacter svalbardensis MN12-7 TaxID=1150600 RepID=R9GYB4_9SPHI|nr:hypothetical protein ADIARSV_0316 [Arcticibacter svalbardensis MN12-7]
MYSSDAFKIQFLRNQQLNEHLARQMNGEENVFIVDSIPVPVCKSFGKNTQEYAGKTSIQRLIKDILRLTRLVFWI